MWEAPTKTYGRVDVLIQVSFTSALVGSEWSASHPDLFTPLEKNHGTQRIGGWAPEPVWFCEEVKILDLVGDSNPDLSLVQPVVSSYTDCPTAYFKYPECRIKILILL
jgi:hypothetical protein